VASAALPRILEGSFGCTPPSDADLVWLAQRFSGPADTRAGTHELELFLQTAQDTAVARVFVDRILTQMPGAARSFMKTCEHRPWPAGLMLERAAAHLGTNTHAWKVFLQQAEMPDVLFDDLVSAALIATR
jgi:hypothetical protein